MRASKLSCNDKVKVLHINTFDCGGGAANAALRICESLNVSEDFNSKLWVQGGTKYHRHDDIKLIKRCGEENKTIFR
ncbi:hypothetical protein D1115_14130 [Vibrio alfacsensis]|uniref:Carbohydrate kinase PfkB domain-containing protein n=1 Tax=Vibrio alfacsensis TaxID=1074311 RepID=A0ABN5PFV4_9VIBR|nr:hypothetical protein D1115_14130 [Vibrio alfacsensis]